MKKKARHKIPQQFPASLARVLRSYRRGLLSDVALRRTAQAVAYAAAVIVFSCAFDRFVDVAGLWRAPLPWLAGGVLCVLFVRMLGGLAMRPNYDRLANTLDRATDDSRDHLRTVLDLSLNGHTGGFFAQASCESAAERWRERSPRELIDRKPTRRWLAAAAVCIGVIAASASVESVRAPLLWQRFLDPMGNYARPTATWFEIDAQDAKQLLAGDDMEIRARLAGRKVKSPSPLIRIGRSDGTYTIRRLDARDAGEFIAQLKQVQGSFTWQLSMGRVRSKSYHVPVLPRPSVAGVTVTYNYPRYARIPPATEQLAGRTIAALAGTRVQVTLRSNVELASAEGVTQDDTVRFRISRDNRREAVFHRIISDNHQMRIRLASTNDVESKHELPLNFRAIPDNPPSVSMINDIDGKSFFLTDTLEIAYRAQDDLGLSALYVNGIDIDLPEFGAAVADGVIRVPVADLVASPARFVRLCLLAKDTADQDGRSPTVTINVASDSFDRQLRALLHSYTGVDQHHLPNRGMNALEVHKQRLARLREIRNNITVLLYSLEPEKPPGEQHNEQVERIRADLKEFTPPFYYATYWFHDFRGAALLSRFREMAEYANIWSHLGGQGHELRSHFEQALKAPDAKAAMQVLISKVNTVIEKQEAIEARVSGDYRQIVRELAGYLASTSARQLSAATADNWQDENFVVNRRTALQEMLRYLATTLRDEAPDAETLAAVETAAAVNSRRADMEAAVPVLHTIAETLRENSSSAFTARLKNGDILRSNLVESLQPSARILLPLSLGLMHGVEIFDTDELFLLDNTLRFLHIEAGINEPFEQVAGNRERETFNLFQALMRCRSEVEHLRLGASSGRLFAGSPETEMQWLRVREARLALEEAAGNLPDDALENNDELENLIESLSPFGGWLPVAELHTIEFLEGLGRVERVCNELAGPLKPDVERLLRKIDEEIASRTPLLFAALRSYVESIDREIAFFKETKTEGVGNVHAMKVRLAALQAASMKLLDFAQLAAIHGVGGRSDINQLAAVFTGICQTMQFFDEKIEAIFSTSTHRADIAGGTFDTMWVGKVKGYGDLRERVNAVLELEKYSRDKLDSNEAMEVYERIQNRFAYQSERQAVREAMRVKDRLQAPEALLDELSERGTDSAVVWEKIHYLLQVLRSGRTKQADNGNHEAPRTAGGSTYGNAEIMAELRTIRNLPDDIDEVLGLLQEAGNDQQTIRESHEMLDGIIEDVSIALPPLKQPRATPSLVPEKISWHWINWGALDRARQRARERLATDRRMLRRRMLEALLGDDIDESPPISFTWASGEVEFNRRKAGLQLNRTELGGIALSGGEITLNLPEHIYQELRRAREGAMPELFREQCYEYLNTVMQKARN